MSPILFSSHVPVSDYVYRGVLDPSTHREHHSLHKECHCGFIDSLPLTSSWGNPICYRESEILSCIKYARNLFSKRETCRNHRSRIMIMKTINDADQLCRLFFLCFFNVGICTEN